MILGVGGHAVQRPETGQLRVRHPNSGTSHFLFGVTPGGVRLPLALHSEVGPGGVQSHMGCWGLNSGWLHAGAPSLTNTDLVLGGGVFWPHPAVLVGSSCPSGLTPGWGLNLVSVCDLSVPPAVLSLQPFPLVIPPRQLFSCAPGPHAPALFPVTSTLSPALQLQPQGRPPPLHVCAFPMGTGS